MMITQDRPVLGDEHKMFQETVRRFYKEECEPNLKAWEEISSTMPSFMRNPGFP